MKKKNSTQKVNLVFTFFLIVFFIIFTIFLLIQNGAFNPAPVIDVTPNNSYEETLYVVTDDDYLPYSFYDENGKMSGHDVELMIMLANEMQMNLDIQFAPWDDAIQKYVNGESDVLLTCDFFDEFEGAEDSLVTEPVSIDEFVVYSKGKIKNVDELYSKSIGVMENANVLPYIDMLSLTDKCVVFESNKEAMMAVENGEIDCMVVRYAVGEAIIKELGCKDVTSTLSIGNSYICFDVRSDRKDLLTKLDSAIETLKQNGEMDRLHNKWLTTFVHEYSFVELISNNIWLIIVFALLALSPLLVYLANERNRMLDESEYSTRIMKLEDKFESLYDLELDTGAYESYIKGQTLGNIETRIVNSNKFYDDLVENSEVIFWQDRKKMFQTLEPGFIREQLEKANHYDFYYRLIVDDIPTWVRMRIMYKDATKKNVIMGVFNAEEEMNTKEKDEQTRREQIAKMAGGVSSYIVNPQTGRFTILSQDAHLSANYPEAEDFYTSTSRYIENDVFPADRKTAKEGLSLPVMVKHLETEPEYTFRFRDISSGFPRWYELRAVTLSENEILYGFTDKDDEIINNLIFEKLEDDFFAMFYLNMDSELVEVVKDGPGLVAKKGDIMSYDDLLEKMSESFKGEAREFLDRNSTIDDLKNRFVSEDKSFYVYKSQLEDGNKWATVTELVLARHKDGTPSLLSINFSMLDSEAGEKEELKLELQAARDIAEAANQSKTNFLFNMSHDIRTPMNAITGFTNMAKKYIDDKYKVFGYLEKIETSGQQLLSLINQVLEMARIESGNVDLVENRVNVREEYDVLITVFSEQAWNNGLEFVPEIKDIVHHNLIADQARMSSIVLNIVGNAIKYTLRGGRIDFVFREIPPRKKDHASFTLTVSDTGIGMSEEYLKVLFDPFTREKSSTVSKIQGTGLGMSIVKDLVSFMDGDIKVWSELGVGTKFEVTMDFLIDTLGEIEEEAIAEKFHVSLAGKHALVVEDNEMNREIATDILEDEDIVVETAEDGTIALDILKEKGPDYYDFILMDIQMPIMGGFEATQKIRELYPSLKAPIIALSANAFTEDREASIVAGMDDHVAKPIKISELLGVLSKYHEDGD